MLPNRLIAISNVYTPVWKQYQKSSAKIHTFFDIYKYFDKENQLFSFCQLHFTFLQNNAGGLLPLQGAGGPRIGISAD